MSGMSEGLEVNPTQNSYRKNIIRATTEIPIMVIDPSNLTNPLQLGVLLGIADCEGKARIRVTDSRLLRYHLNHLNPKRIDEVDSLGGSMSC